jgi:hypothetical protein
MIGMRIEEPGGPDAVSISSLHPVYQVTIFEPLDEPADVPPEQRSVEANEWKLHDVDVDQVLEWARGKAGSLAYVVEVAAPLPGGKSKLVRLFGNDPTWGEPLTDAVYQHVEGVTPDQM